MQRIERHGVGEDRITRALADIEKRADRHYIGLRYNSSGLQAMRAMGRDLFDHVAARSVEDPALASDPAFTRKVLATAAEACFGALDRSLFPDGDFDIPFPLVYGRLTNMDDDSEENITLEYGIDLAPSPGLWAEAFAMCLVGRVLWEPGRMIGPLLREDFAPQFHEGLPYARMKPEPDPADLAQIDALRIYLNGGGPRPGHPRSVLCRPGAEERARAARGLDSAGGLSPEQRLLRVLLEDDQAAFERALAEHLVRHREAMEADGDAAPGTLLPVGVIALAALAVQAHGWRLEVTSDYLPEALLHAPEGASEVPAR
ncbi:immunity 49 family protein [Nocardiopsis sp. CNT-189]|uniref:immunity 49 family protein n=1 Tax=Nocardiopsis oceanisediminis TaxID=2816862 RepID=UPI003B37ECC6